MLTPDEPARIGYERLDHDAAVGREVGGDGGEAAALRIGVEQREERAVRAEAQGLAAVQLAGGEVADGARSRVAARLRPQLRHRGYARIDAPHGAAPAGERQPKPSRADAELQRRPVIAEPGQKRDGGVSI